MRFLVLLAWLVATAAGWTFGSVWSLESAAVPPLAPSMGAPIRSTPGESPAGSAAKARPAPDRDEIDFEHLEFEDYDPPGLRRSPTPLVAADFPEAARGLDGKELSIVGFSQTLRVAEGATEQLMVSRYPPGCCFGAVPVFDEWLLVELEEPVDLVELPGIVRATGTLVVGEVVRGTGVECLYRLVRARVAPY